MPAKWASRFTLYRAWTVWDVRLWLSLISECSVFLEKWAWSDLYPTLFISALCLQGSNKLFKEDCLSLFLLSEAQRVPDGSPRCGAWMWLPHLFQDKNWELCCFLSSSLRCFYNEWGIWLGFSSLLSEILSTSSWISLWDKDTWEKNIFPLILTQPSI